MCLGIKRLLLVFLISITSYAQETVKVWRFNFVNPGVELELPVSRLSTVSYAVGFGLGYAYPNLIAEENEYAIIVSPFIDVQYKYFYNFKKRASRWKTTKNNSGNFISGRIVLRGNSIQDQVTRHSQFDIAIGPTWGIQRMYRQFHLLFDAGPQFYIDLEGNGGFMPMMLQLNIGLDLKKTVHYKCKR